MGDVFQTGTRLRAVAKMTADRKIRDRMTLRMGTISQRKSMSICISGDWATPGNVAAWSAVVRSLQRDAVSGL